MNTNFPVRNISVKLIKACSQPHISATQCQYTVHAKKAKPAKHYKYMNSIVQVLLQYCDGFVHAQIHRAEKRGEHSTLRVRKMMTKNIWIDCVKGGWLGSDVIKNYFCNTI